MNTITKSIGQCIRKFRQQSDLSQERLAELASCDATYLGEIERGERNASIEVIKRIADALQIPLSKLFEKVDGIDAKMRNIPQECYDLVASKTADEQECIWEIIAAVERYRKG